MPKDVQKSIYWMTEDDEKEACEIWGSMLTDRKAIASDKRSEQNIFICRQLSTIIYSDLISSISDNVYRTPTKKNYYWIILIFNMLERSLCSSETSDMIEMTLAIWHVKTMIDSIWLFYLQISLRLLYAFRHFKVLSLRTSILWIALDISV